MQYVLLLTHSGDFFTIDRVQEALLEHGLHPVRVNTDDFPQSLSLSTQLGVHGLEVTLSVPGQLPIGIQQVAAVWTRRIWTPRIDPNMDEAYRRICMRESSVTLKNTLALFSHALWMDPLHCIERADNKLLQLHTALSEGLTIPATLVTNDAQAAESFYDLQNGQVVSKMSTPASYSMNKTSLFVHTSKVTAEDAENFESLSLCPMIFQREIPKDYELRIVYVSGKFFSGGIRAAQLTDWRQSGSEATRWFECELPAPVATRLDRMMKKLQLSFGAIDMIKTPDGEYVFLEVNPVGEWGMLEKELNYSISGAIAGSIFQRIQAAEEVRHI